MDETAMRKLMGLKDPKECNPHDWGPTFWPRVGSPRRACFACGTTEVLDEATEMKKLTQKPRG